MKRFAWIPALLVIAGCSSEPSSGASSALVEPGAISGSGFRITSVSIEGLLDGEPVSAHQQVGRGWVLDSSAPVITALEAGNVVRDEHGWAEAWPELLTTIDLPGRLEDATFAPGAVGQWTTPQIRGESGEVLPPPDGQVYGLFCFNHYTECLPQIDATTRTIEHADGSRTLVHDATYGLDGAPRAHVVTTWNLVDASAEPRGI